MKKIMTIAIAFLLAACGSAETQTEKLIEPTSSSSSGGAVDAGSDAPSDPGQTYTLECVSITPCPISSTLTSCVVGSHKFPGESRYKIEATTWVVNDDGTISTIGAKQPSPSIYFPNALAKDGEVMVACAQTCPMQGQACTATAASETVQVFVLDP